MLSEAVLVFLFIFKLQSNCMDVYVISVLFNLPIKKNLTVATRMAALGIVKEFDPDLEECSS